MVRRDLLSFVLRRGIQAALLVFVASSVAVIVVGLAPGDHVSVLEVDRDSIVADRARLGLDRPIAVQYASWLARAIRLDFGESVKYRRPVNDLIAERAGNTILLGGAALLLATVVGVPAGVLTGSHRGWLLALARGVSVIVLSVPPLVMSFGLLLLALFTGWLPVGGVGPGRADGWLALTERARYLVLPTIALAVPIAALLERLQSRSIEEALREPCIRAVSGRGVPAGRVIWRHGFRLSLKPVLAVYGAIVGSVLSGSFVVEIVMSWPGLGALMYEALVARDLFLVAGCAATGSLLLACGVFASDVALAVADPRIEPLP